MAAQTSFEKIFLSGSTNGLGIKITTTASPGTTVHPATNTAGETDEIWLYVHNTSSSAVIAYVEWGGTTAPDNLIYFSILPRDTVKCIMPGMLLAGGLVVKVYGGTGNVLVAYGHAIRMS